MNKFSSKTIIAAVIMILGGSLGLDLSAQTAKQKPRTELGAARGVRIFALRLKPGQDLRQEIEAFAKENQIRAGFIITTVGSLRRAELRLADQSSSTLFEGKFEIVSLVGTLSPEGVHLHISLSDSTGKTIGGHLVAGCLVYTTAEIVIGDARGLSFSREQDAQTGYQELKIRRPKRMSRSPSRGRQSVSKLGPDFTKATY